jgi:hypothetical protein
MTEEKQQQQSLAYRLPFPSKGLFWGDGLNDHEIQTSVNKKYFYI